MPPRRPLPRPPPPVAPSVHTVTLHPRSGAEMARGKNAAAAARRRAAQTSAQAEALRAEIAAEEQALAEVEAQVGEVDELREQLAEATTARTEGTASERDRLRGEVQL